MDTPGSPQFEPSGERLPLFSQANGQGKTGQKLPFWTEPRPESGTGHVPVETGGKGAGRWMQGDSVWNASGQSELLRPGVPAFDVSRY